MRTPSKCSSFLSAVSELPWSPSLCPSLCHGRAAVYTHGIHSNDRCQAVSLYYNKYNNKETWQKKKRGKKPPPGYDWCFFTVSPGTQKEPEEISFSKILKNLSLLFFRLATAALRKWMFLDLNVTFKTQRSKLTSTEVTIGRIVSIDITKSCHTFFILPIIVGFFSQYLPRNSISNYNCPSMWSWNTAALSHISLIMPVTTMITARPWIWMGNRF